MEDMIICVVCRKPNPLGTTWCKKCRSRLRIFDTMRLSDHAPVHPRKIGPYPDNLPPRSLALRFMGNRAPLLVRVDDEVVLGRAMPNSADRLVDLSAHRAALLGVSRQHALITRRGRTFTLEDLRSTNGTWVNGSRVVPGLPHTLENGDQLQLGELILYVALAPRITPAAV